MTTTSSPLVGPHVGQNGGDIGLIVGRCLVEEVEVIFRRDHPA